MFIRGLAGAGLILLVASLALLAKTTQNSAEFSRMHFQILAVNAVGVIVLLVLIIGNLARLAGDFRRGTPGARLKARMLMAFVWLSVLPLLVVYLFSMYFLNSGIDSYFDVRVEKGLQDALQLSQTAMNVRLRERLKVTQSIADDLAAQPESAWIEQLGSWRQRNQATEAIIVGEHHSIVAASSDLGLARVPTLPPEDVLIQARRGLPYAVLEPLGGGGLFVRTAVAIPTTSGLTSASQTRVIHALFPVLQDLAGYADSVQAAFTDYERLAYLRKPLKDSFKLTLSLVLLVSLFLAVWAAIFFARRLVAPIQDLAAGTRAVAKGDFDQRLPVTTHDDIGFLVDSFNVMTDKLSQAREVATASKQEVEAERANLEVILARLSTGVLALEEDRSIRAANQAAASILGIDLAEMRGRQLDEIAVGRPLLQRFAEVCEAHIATDKHDWREQIVLRGEVGQRVLMCACSALPSGVDEPGGYVIVFDDITALLQAQRDAAWGEVARRLAHEIKNPLTPIQLAAERLQRHYAARMGPEEAQLIERSTRTIVQQVEAMKAMVDAFRDYARAPDMEMTLLDVNRLVGEIADLYRVQEMGVRLELDLSPELPLVSADAGRLRQILHNLLRNAVEATQGQETAAVTVTTRIRRHDDQEVAEIAVEDNGRGIPQDLQERVFEPYVTSKPKGTGLGLAIVKKLVEEHSGQINIDNLATGGARVTLLLPIDEEARAGFAERANDFRRERA